MMRQMALLSLLALVLAAQLSWSQIPQTMGYQGMLTDASGDPMPDGSFYGLTFKLYENETGGAAVWEESHASVTIADGVFSVILGISNPLNLDFDKQYWLGVTFGGTELAPRTKLTSSPYSLNAQSVSDGAVTEDKIAANAVTTFHILNGTIAAEDVGFNYADSTASAGPAIDLVSSGAVDTTDIADDAVTGDKIADDQVVRSLNSKMDDVTLAEGANVTITPSGNTLTISSTFDGWSLTGNAGTNPTTNFLGTTDDQALELRVNNLRILRLELGTVPDGATANVIAGYSGNYVEEGVWGATIAGGGNSYVSGGNIGANRVTGNHGSIGGGAFNIASGNSSTVGGGYDNKASANTSTVDGGQDNTASGTSSTVGGGNNNTASGYTSTVGGGYINAASGGGATVSGGYDNTASGDYATVGGGHSNTASGISSTVGGGYGNTASGNSATVPGGYGNIAQSNYSFVAGYRAKAAHLGSFVFADASMSTTFSSIRANEFAVRCTGGARFYSQWTPSTAGVWLPHGGAAWSGLSDRNAKANFAQVDGRETLERLASIPVETWNYKSQAPSIRHMGPMAQDFYATFSLGEDDRYISTIDADGIALAAIQGLYELAQEKDAQIAVVKAENETLKERLDKQETRLRALEALVSGRD